MRLAHTKLAQTSTRLERVSNYRVIGLGPIQWGSPGDIWGGGVGVMIDCEHGLDLSKGHSKLLAKDAFTIQKR
jgi:hypothetical protein